MRFTTATRKRLLALSVGLTATSAAADSPVILSGCETDPLAQSMACDVQNVSDEAIAGLSYDLRLMEGDRAVPWGVSEGDVQIPGGIEPGETKRLTFETYGLPLDGWSEALHPIGDVVSVPWQVSAIETDVRPISRPNRPFDREAPPLTGAELDAFRVAVQECWVVDPAAQSAGVSVTIVFELDQQGRVIAGPDLLTSSGGTPGDVAAAFQAASRAVTRCADRDGYDLPVEKYDQWHVVELTFAATGMPLR